MTEQSPYASVIPFGKAPATHISSEAPLDVARVQSYDTYSDIYHNMMGVYDKVIALDAGNDQYRRLIPVARQIVEAVNRYLARGLTWVAAPPVAGTAADSKAGAQGAAAGSEAIAAAMDVLQALFAREEFGAKFLSMKRWGLIRGDAMLHITADPSKPEGGRLRIVELHPSSYFALQDPSDSERVVGCYVVNIVGDDDGDEIVARLEYRKVMSEGQASTLGAPLGSVYVKLGFYELDGWDDRRTADDLAPVGAPSRFSDERFAVLLAGGPLPAQITALPVYHFRNKRRGGEMYGLSELQGLETLFIGVNQTATDEEVSIAMTGMGVYTTDSGTPVDPQGNEVGWQISPASVLELTAGTSFSRVGGITSIEPSLAHMSMLKGEAREAAATPDVAVGRAEVAVAESGVALGIQMAPMIANKEEKEEEIHGKLSQLVFDLLNGWLPAYEAWTPNGVTVTPMFEDAIPKNRAQIITEITALVTAKIMSAATARIELNKELGMQFPVDEGDLVAGEGAAALDVAGARMDAAIGAPGAPAPDAGAEVGL